MNCMEEYLPPGFRFHPTDEELVTYYLNNKIADCGFTCRAITAVDLNKCEPWDLPVLASMGEKEWYFFNLKDRKYPTGLRTNRATQAGYWKTTGKDKEIYKGSAIVGLKKTLVFYRGRAPKGEKSNWVMHEYRPEVKPTFKSNKDEWVVCRVFKKSSSTAKKPPHTPSSSSQQYTALDDSLTPTNILTHDFGETIEIPNHNVPNGGSSTRSYDSSADHQLSNMIQPQNQYNISSMNMNMNMDFDWAMSKQTSAQAVNITSLLTDHNDQSLQKNAATSSYSSPNMAFNSLLLKALQLRSYQPGPLINPSMMTSIENLSALNTPAQQLARNVTSSFGTDYNSKMLAPSSSSSKEQLQVQDQVQEQAFSMDSIW